jgi:ArsR family transcriptional regulator
MTKRKMPSPEAIELISWRFAVLSAPIRLRLIHALFEGEKNVNTLVKEVGATQANASRHLQTLCQAHVVARRKEGLQVFYSLADSSIIKLCELVCGSLEKQLAKQAEVFTAAPKSNNGNKAVAHGRHTIDRKPGAST